MGFARNLTYGVAGTLGSTGTWPASYNKSDYREWMLGKIGAAPTDLVIKEAHVHDEMLERPVEWINAQVSRFNGELV